MEAVQRAAETLSSACTAHRGADLGTAPVVSPLPSVRRFGRRAGWWKSPCPDLVRAPVGDGRGYSTERQVLAKSPKKRTLGPDANPRRARALSSAPWLKSGSEPKADVTTNQRESV